MSKKQKIIGAVAGLVLLGVGFWGGTMYGKGSPSGTNTQFAAGGAFPGRTTGTGMGSSNMRTAGGGATMGEIIAKDATSITIKMQDGSTKIVLMGGTTEVTKSVPGSASDLSVGTSVTVLGAANADGSLTAQSVQIRPAGMASPAGMVPPQAQ